ncbi:hypothetical protein [Thermodesulfitimonas sp.]
MHRLQELQNHLSCLRQDLNNISQVTMQLQQAEQQAQSQLAWLSQQESFNSQQLQRIQQLCLSLQNELNTISSVAQQLGTTLTAGQWGAATQWTTPQYTGGHYAGAGQYAGAPQYTGGAPYTGAYGAPYTGTYAAPAAGAQTAGYTGYTGAAFASPGGYGVSGQQAFAASPAYASGTAGVLRRGTRAPALAGQHVRRQAFLRARPAATGEPVFAKRGCPKSQSGQPLFTWAHRARSDSDSTNLYHCQ